MRKCLLETLYSLHNNQNRLPIIHLFRFTHGITTWPCLNELGPESCSSTMCGACEKGKATTQLQMFGQPYNNNTLATLPPKPEAMLNRVSCFQPQIASKLKIFWLAVSKTVGINSNAVALIHYWFACLELISSAIDLVQQTLTRWFF